MLVRVIKAVDSAIGAEKKSCVEEEQIKEVWIRSVMRASIYYMLLKKRFHASTNQLYESK